MNSVVLDIGQVGRIVIKPYPVFRVNEKIKNIVGGKAVLYRKYLEGLTIEPCYALVCSYPRVALVVLYNAVNLIAGQAIPDGVMVENSILGPASKRG